MKNKNTSVALLIFLGLLSSTISASAYTILGSRYVSGNIYNFSPGVDLTGALIGNYDLAGADLSGVILANAQLEGVTLNNANLTGAVLTNAFMHGASFFMTDLTNANLVGATLTTANFFKADLTGATVSYDNWTDFQNNSGGYNLGSYMYDRDLVNFVGRAVPEPSTYGLIGIGALGVAFAARRRKLKSA